MYPVNLYQVQLAVSSAERVVIDRVELDAELDHLQAQWEEATEHNMEAVSLDLGLFFDDLRRLIGSL